MIFEFRQQPDQFIHTEWDKVHTRELELKDKFEAMKFATQLAVYNMAQVRFNLSGSHLYTYVHPDDGYGYIPIYTK